MKEYLVVWSLILLCFSCNRSRFAKSIQTTQADAGGNVSLVVLGTVQDAGSPHIACAKDCCKDLFEHPDKSRKVVSLGLIDAPHKKAWLFEATPDITIQMQYLQSASGLKTPPEGIFLTLAHIGHYAGLMYLGRETMNASNVRVYTMPRMKSFLETDGPWSQLVRLQNITIVPLQAEKRIQLSATVSVIPFLVPHRDEYTETVGYIIEGPRKKALFIPDIDKWEKWEKSIIDEIQKVDYAFLDATFYDGSEVANRDISQIPHPFVIESMQTFKDLSASEREKIYFIHFNHTNPLLDSRRKEAKAVMEKGFHIAGVGQVIEL